MFSYETADVNGKRLAYIKQNDWEDEVILFFHGFTGSKEYFPEIATDKCIISFDRPGVGDSSVVDSYTMDDFLTSVYEVLKVHKVSSIKLIGHSAGGYYAQLFSQMYPNIVTSLSLVSSMIPLNCSQTKKIVNVQWKLISFLSTRLKSFAKFYFKQMAKSILNDYDKQLAENMRKLPEIEKQFMEQNKEFVKNAIIKAVSNDGLGVCFDAFALCQKRQKIVISEDIPVYVWHGLDDKTIPISFVNYFENNYNVKKVHKIDDVGHMLYLPYWDEIICEI